MARKAVPGEETAHDAFEGLLDVVWKQERLWQLNDRIDAQLARDESRARRKAPADQGTQGKPAARSYRRTSRARRRRSAPRLRDPRARKTDEPKPHAHASRAESLFTLGLFAAGLSAIYLTALDLVGLGFFALALTVLGLVFAAIRKAVKILL